MTAETNALNVQVQRRVRRARNARLLRGVLVTLLITVAMVMLAISNRDQQEFKASRKAMERVATLIVEQPERVRLPSSKWIVNRGFAELAAERGEAGVCAGPVDLFLWPDGWHVLVYRAGKYEVTWMDWRAFRERGSALGLTSP